MPVNTFGNYGPINVPNAGQWYHETQYTQGPGPRLVAKIDYQVGSPKNAKPEDGFEQVATNVWLNVTGRDAQLPANESLQVAFLDNPTASGDQQQVETGIPLTDAGNGRYTAQLPDTLLLRQVAGGVESTYTQQLAVRLGDDPSPNIGWQTADGGGGNNINYNFESGAK
jgi:hypothetical protein